MNKKRRKTNYYAAILLSCILTALAVADGAQEAQLEQMSPMDESSFKTKIAELVGGYTKGKDAGKLRIVVKRKES